MVVGTVRSSCLVPSFVRFGRRGSAGVRSIIWFAAWLPSGQEATAMAALPHSATRDRVRGRAVSVCVCAPIPSRVGYVGPTVPCL